MMIVAVDPSLKCTGLALLSPITEPDPYWRLRSIRSAAPNNPPNMDLAQLHRMQRIVVAIRTGIEELGFGVPPTYAVLEAPAFSKNEGMAHERAGLWWFIYQMLVGYRVPILVVKPNLRAKYATGNGGAGKDEVMLAASRRYVAAPITNNNEADAVVLAAMGARMLSRPVDKLPLTHLDALKTLRG